MVSDGLYSVAAHIIYHYYSIFTLDFSKQLKICDQMEKNLNWSSPFKRETLLPESSSSQSSSSLSLSTFDGVEILSGDLTLENDFSGVVFVENLSSVFFEYLSSVISFVGDGVRDLAVEFRRENIFDSGDKSRQLPNRDGLPIVGDCDDCDDVSSLLDDSSSSYN